MNHGKPAAVSLRDREIACLVAVARHGSLLAAGFALDTTAETVRMLLFRARRRYGCRTNLQLLMVALSRGDVRLVGGRLESGRAREEWAS